jgi:Uma2 family endonuclease
MRVASSRNAHGGPMAETRTLMTADQLLRMPNDGWRYELVAGELRRMAPAGGEHGYVGIRATRLLDRFIEKEQLGGSLFAAETGFRIFTSPDTVRAADVAYVGPERLDQARVRGYPNFAPDLVVEVVSPGDTASEVHEKVMEWLEAGARLVWALYPRTRSVVVHRPGGEARVLRADDTLDAEPVLPGFSCRVGDLFG